MDNNNINNVPEQNELRGGYADKLENQQPSGSPTAPQYSRVGGDGQYRYVPQNSGYVPVNNVNQYQQTYPVYNAQSPQYAQNPTYVRYAQPVQDSGNTSSGWFSAKKKLLAGIAIGIAACVLLGGIGVAAVRGIRRSAAPDSQKDPANLIIAETPVTEVIVPEDDATLLNYAQIAAKVRSGVVGVTCYTNANGWGTFTYSQGSGFIITDTGYVVTNSHVINDDDHSKYDITVTVTDTNGENQEVEAEVIGYDKRSDLAVLKFDPKDLSFSVCELGDSTALVLGEEVVAIGNPGGAQFAGSVTNGIVSGLNRVIEDNNGASDTSIKYIQTNAAINPGNSGGPLLNMYGQVIGITSSKIVASGYEGLGFAIPTVSAKPIVEELISKGYISRPAMGVKLSEISEQSAQWYDVPQGLLIRDIAINSSFIGKNAQVGDIITAINGKDSKNFTEFQNIIDECKVGDTIKVTLFRRGESQTFDVDITLISDMEAQYAETQQNFFN